MWILRAPEGKVTKIPKGPHFANALLSQHDHSLLIFTHLHTHTRPGVAILSKRAFIPPLLGKLPWKQTRT